VMQTETFAGAFLSGGGNLFRAPSVQK